MRNRKGGKENAVDHSDTKPRSTLRTNGRERRAYTRAKPLSYQFLTTHNTVNTTAPCSQFDVGQYSINHLLNLTKIKNKKKHYDLSLLLFTVDALRRHLGVQCCRQVGLCEDRPTFRVKKSEFKGAFQLPASKYNWNAALDPATTANGKKRIVFKAQVRVDEAGALIESMHQDLDKKRDLLSPPRSKFRALCTVDLKGPEGVRARSKLLWTDPFVVDLFRQIEYKHLRKEGRPEPKPH
ncbi:Hypothetical predicted protein [Xyrichtys novacula]|uniref:Uncharacterized protein n=1 Tax=Xyrichtys novacula TaxID=13765 RepID=A0AAV1GTZ5_XYRNO|nr:Hypothetical predicted protein [Xyrichtys novacula]